MMVFRGFFAKIVCSSVAQSFIAAIRRQAPSLQRLAFAINIELIPLLETPVETPLENAT